LALYFLNRVGKAKSCLLRNKGLPVPAFSRFAQAIEVKVNDRRGVKDQTADNHVSVRDVIRTTLLRESA
jgi:hypothetical protein